MASWRVGGGVDPTYTVTLPRSFPSQGRYVDCRDAPLAGLEPTGGTGEGWAMSLSTKSFKGSAQASEGLDGFQTWPFPRSQKVKKSPGRTFFVEPTRSRPEVCRFFFLLLENSSLWWKDWNINLNHTTYGQPQAWLWNTWLWIFSEIYQIRWIFGNHNNW